MKNNLKSELKLSNKPRWQFSFYQLLIIGIFLCLGLVLLFKIWRETYWVERFERQIDENIKVKIKIDPDLWSFPDWPAAKQLSIFNSKTKASLKINYSSDDWDIYFYHQKNEKDDILIIGDKWIGYMFYDYQTMKKIQESDANPLSKAVSPETNFMYNPEESTWAFIYKNESKMVNDK